MATLQDYWNHTLAQANKALGSKGSVPITRMLTALGRAKELDPLNADFEKGVDALANKLCDLQDGLTKVNGALDQAQNEIQGSDFGLNPKDPNDKKRIAQADAIFKTFFATAEKISSNSVQKLSDLDKHMEHLDKYKSTKI
jgi:hypothetical protein